MNTPSEQIMVLMPVFIPNDILPTALASPKFILPGPGCFTSVSLPPCVLPEPGASDQPESAEPVAEEHPDAEAQPSPEEPCWPSEETQDEPVRRGRKRRTQ